MSQKYEYKIVEGEYIPGDNYRYSGYTSQIEENTINQLAAEGWKFVTWMSDNYSKALFERPVLLERFDSKKMEMALRNINAIAGQLKRNPNSRSTKEIADILLLFVQTTGIKSSWLRNKN